jgi:hypothetical protein
MAPLYRPHLGWENEQLAHYLLSRFSFVAHPATIGDDIGSDFYCTMFEILDSEPPKIKPRISFAIQVKSNAERIDVGNKIAYLEQLEVPFFVGAVDQVTSSLKIYSAECLPMMFANYGGEPENLSLRLVDKPHQYQSPDAYVDAQGASPRVAYWDTEPAGRKLVLNCFHVCTFNTSESRETIRPSAEKVLEVCRRAALNIGSRRVEEHLYEWPNEGITVYGGPGSAKHFRDNTLKRVAEAFVNFAWILDNDPSKFNLDEFRAYEKFFVALTHFEVTKALSVTNESYKHARDTVDRHFSGPIQVT